MFAYKNVNGEDFRANPTVFLWKTPEIDSPLKALSTRTNQLLLVSVLL